MSTNVRGSTVLAAFALVGFVAAQAQTTFNWQDPGSGLTANWSSAAHWGGTVPPTGDNAVIGVNSTTVDYTVTLDSGPISLNRITVSGRRAALVVDNAAVTTTQATYSFYVTGTTNPNSAQVTFTNGATLTATGINIGGGNTTYRPSLTVQDGASLAIGNAWLEGAALLTLKGNASSSTTGAFYLLTDSKVDVQTGHTFALNNVLMTGGNSGVITKFTVTGGAVTVAGNLAFDRTGGVNYGGKAEVSAGTLTAARGNLGYKMPGQADQYYDLVVTGTGQATFTDFLRLGFRDAARGRLLMDSGILTVKDVHLGAHADGTGATNQGGRGYYSQTGGSATITGTATFYTDSPDSYPTGAPAADCGTYQFVVGPGATMVLTGAGMAKSGTLDWIPSFTDAGNLDLGGTLRYAPATSGTNQNLLAFGADTGAGAGANSFPVGVLDLAALPDASATLTVLPSGTFDSNALYVNNLLGLTPADVGTHIVSTVPVYYDSKLNPIFQYGTYTLTGGGLFQPFNVPEPSSLALLAVAAAGILARRRPQR